MAKVYLSLGSNQGDRLNSLVKATRLINIRVGKLMLYSPVVESEPWGFSAEINFYNQVLLVETKFEPHRVLSEIMGIEKELGRIRDGRTYTSRLIDIDILFYNDELFNDSDLVIPHPQLHLRRFVLEPICTIAPDLIHPCFKTTISELLNKLQDTSHLAVAVDTNEFAKLMNTKNLSEV